MYLILCIDDNRNNLFTIKALLEQLDDIEVVTALSAKEGLKILLSQSVDLIFLDIQMPEIDGFEAAKLIKSNKHTVNIPIIFITAVFKSEEFKSRGYEVGAIEYISKPIDDHQLLNKVRLYIKLHESQNRLLVKNKKLLSNQHDLEIAYAELKEKDEIMIDQSRQAAMGEMTSMIGHQWRQPLTAISMIANNLLAAVAFDDIQSEDIKTDATKILEQTIHLSKTIDDFTNFFKTDKQAEVTFIQDILEENFKIIANDLEYHHITLKKNYNSETPITLYSRELLHVFMNILNNAREALIKHHIDKPYISVTTNEDANNIYISICDNAKGIEASILTKIYDPYFSTKDEKNGAGLGLYISKTIIQKHLNGTIRAVNRQQGGLCMEISLSKTGTLNAQS